MDRKRTVKNWHVHLDPKTALLSPPIRGFSIHLTLNTVKRWRKAQGQNKEILGMSKVKSSPE